MIVILIHLSSNELFPARLREGNRLALTIDRGNAFAFQSGTNFSATPLLQ